MSAQSPVSRFFQILNKQGFQFFSRRRALFAAAALVFVTGCPRKASPPPQVAASTLSPPIVSAAKLDKVQFVNITESAGIHWQHFSGARGKKYMPEIAVPACAFIDFNNDGRPDIVLLNGADWPDVTSNRKHSQLGLYRNDGGNHFTDVTAGSGLDIEMHSMGIAVGDYDNDGRDDIYITCMMGPSHLFHNDGNGHFSDVTKRAGVDDKEEWGSGAAWVDYDRDGKLDLVVGNYCQWTPKTDVFCTVYLGKKSYCTPNVYDGTSVRLYHNLGGGRFEDVSKKSGLRNTPGKTWGVAILDYDGDGWPDIALANDIEPNCLYHNEKNGTFKEVGLVTGIALGENGNAKAGMGIDAADIDDSGRPSIIVSNFIGEGLSLFRNQGGARFNEEAHAWQVSDVSILKMGWGVFFFDYDLDGRLDVLVCNGHLYENVEKFQPGVTFMQSPLLFRNEGSTFAEVGASHGSDLMKPMVARGAAYADIDGDGDIDVLIMANDGSPRLLRNDGGNTNHWLRVHTVGTKSNRDGIGAKVVAELGGVKQTRWVKSGSSFLSASELTLTFGLGSATLVDRLTVYWPSGATDKFVNVKCNQNLEAREGAAPISK